MGRKKNTHYKALNAVQEREKRKRDSGEELSLGVTDAQADEGLVEPEPEASDEGLELKSKRRAKSWEFAGAPEFTADLDQAPFPASSRKRKRNSLPKSPPILLEVSPRRLLYESHDSTQMFALPRRFGVINYHYFTISRLAMRFVLVHQVGHLSSHVSRSRFRIGSPIQAFWCTSIQLSR